MIKKLALGLFASVALGAVSGLAGTATWDFKTDPTTGANPLTLLGSAGGNGGGEWWTQEGYEGIEDGFLSVTGPYPGGWAKIIFPDMDNGAIISAFTFECQLRIGNGTESPADGFSINYARASDPTFTLDSFGNYQSGGWSGTVSEPGSTGGSMAGLAEEGTITGLAIGFDAWNSNSALWPADLNPGINDVIGISVRVDNKVVAQVPLSTPNGECADATSLQTGPRTADSMDFSTMCWQPFKVQLTEDKHLSIWWKGSLIVDNIEVDFAPSAGRLVFGGRTGDAYQNQHIDEIVLTTIAADKAIFNVASADAVSVTAKIEDSGQSVVDTATVTMTVDGAAATPLTVTKDGAITTVRWVSPTYLTAGQELNVAIACQDTRAVAISGSRTATVAPYATIPTAYKVPAATGAGFLLRPYQTEAAQPNTLMWTEEQLLGLHGANIADLTGATGGIFTQTGVLNYNGDATGDAGSFTDAGGFAEDIFPGFPGTTGNTGNSALEVMTYLEFPAADLYQFGVNSDDGFRVTAGRAPGDLLGTILGYYDGGKGASDVLFSVLVTEPGIYPIRLIWENGDGNLPDNGFNLEFFTVKDGVKTLVNYASADAIKAYTTSAAAGPFVSNLTPLRGATGVSPITAVMAEISHGSVTVDSSTVKMKINGTETAASATTVGSKTTVTRTATDMFPSGSTTLVSIEFSDTAAKAYTTEWQFVVTPYTVLPEAVWTAPGTGDATKPGLTARVVQADQLGTTATLNYVYRAEQTLAGLYGPNVADLTAATGGVFVQDVINWYDGTAAGSFQTDEVWIPGIPGTGNASYNTDNISAEIITYIDFPTTGLYAMCVNSDDGFKVTTTDKAPTWNSSLVVEGAESAAGSYATVVAPAATAKPLTSAVTGKLVYMDPADGCTAPVNAADLVGAIAFVDRGTCNFSTKIKFAKDSGAVACVVVNSRPVGHAEGVWPIEMAVGDVGYQDIPAVMITMPDGDKIKTAIAGGQLTATIAPDTTPAVGIADYGKGASDIVFYFIVPKAGVYPFRCVWFEGGGGANCEWFSITASGEKILLNDTALPNALKTYRARTVDPTPTPTIAAAKNAEGLPVLTFTGVLRAATSVNGTYDIVPGATSPFTVTPGTDPAKFYRAASE